MHKFISLSSKTLCGADCDLLFKFPITGADTLPAFLISANKENPGMMSFSDS